MPDLMVTKRERPLRNIHGFWKKSLKIETFETQPKKGLKSLNFEILKSLNFETLVCLSILFVLLRTAFNPKLPVRLF